MGAKSPLAEVELISLVTAFIAKLGLKDAKLHINSIGCPGGNDLCHMIGTRQIPRNLFHISAPVHPLAVPILVGIAELE